MKKILLLVFVMSILVTSFLAFNAEAGNYIICVDYNAGMTYDGQMVFFDNVATNDYPGNIESYNVPYTVLYGWFGSNLAENYVFGYSINDGDIVTDVNFYSEYEEPVRNAIDSQVENAKFYSRYIIFAPVQYGVSVNVKYYAVPNNDSEIVLLGTTTYKRPSPKCKKLSGEITINDSEIPVSVTSSNGIENGIISFEESTKIYVNAIPGEAFNQITIDYSLNVPISAKIKYVVNNKEYEDYLVFQVSDNGTISQYIKGFLDGIKATKIKTIELTNLSNKVAKIEIKSITTSTTSEIGEKIITLKNENITAEIDLSLGGKLTVFDCLTKTDSEGVVLFSEEGENILVSYTKGYNYVYVKTISSELQGCLEKRYILHDNYLEVSNNIQFFNDIPDSENLLTACEFSANGDLNTFAYYPGENSWNNGSLKRLTDISEKEILSTNNSLSGNTETWGALVNSNDFGIGVYLPGAEAFEICLTEDRGYISPEMYPAYSENGNLSYTYLIAEGDLSKIRDIFTTAKDSVSVNWVKEEDFTPPKEKKATEEPTETPIPESTTKPTDKISEDKYKFEGNWLVSIVAMFVFLAVILVIIIANKKKDNAKN